MPPEIWNKQSKPEKFGWTDPLSGIARIADYLGWLERTARESAPEERPPLLDQLAAIWKKQYGLVDSEEALKSFLDGFLTKEALAKQQAAVLGDKLTEFFNRCDEPISMALGDPSDPVADYWRNWAWPPFQSNFDKRLADWTRRVILQKDAKTLRILADALEELPARVLRVGVPLEEFHQAIPFKPAEAKAAERSRPHFRVWEAYQTLFEKTHLIDGVITGRLPTKGEVDALSGVEDVKMCAQYRRDLGLHCLPKSARSS